MIAFFSRCEDTKEKKSKKLFMDRISKLKEYIQVNGDDSFLQHALALEYIKTGNDNEAKKLFNDILKREPTYIGSYYHLGKLLERIGEPRKAMRVYKRGMKEAEALDDSNSYKELQAAYEDVEDELKG
jgi:tetratricopeptide (TPR) repeat protein